MDSEPDALHDGAQFRPGNSDHMSTDRHVEAAHTDVVHAHAIPFALVHLFCFAAIWTGVTWETLSICVALYWLRIFAIGAGYHRYFSHKSYSTSRVFQFILAFLSQTTAQNSVLWWASQHRRHHLYSDTESDTHSPVQRGFFYAHVGWIFDRRHQKADLVKVEDLAKFPELRWLDRYELVPAVVVGFLWSTVLVYHSTFCINSLAHVHGKRRFVTGDQSRNNWLLALFTMGEGWHNNHHAFQSSVRQGFRWWEVDATFYILTALSWIGVVWDLKQPPEALRRGEHKPSERAIERAAAQLAARFNPEPIARAINAALHGAELAALQESLSHARHQASDVLAAVHLPHFPSRDEIVARAKATLAKTPSLDEIVDRAHAMLLAAVSARLAEMAV
jgi:stearoyl-CoA desaturase (delta-9 desaturase)